MGCEDAAVRISTNTLPRVGATQWNDWVTLTGCGTRGAAVIASALRSDGIRGETELTRLDHISNLLDGWFQPSLISAYQALLRAPNASYGMRLRAMWLLSGLYAPNVDVAGPLQGYMSARCESYERMTSLRDAPATLPASAYDQARDAIAYVASDGAAPEYVRATARCWAGVVNAATNSANNAGTNASDREMPRDIPRDDRTVIVETSAPPPVVIERPVRVIYECDNRFVFYNDAGYDLAVRYGGYESSGVLRVSHGGPYLWTAGRFGPVRFWVGDEEVWYTDVVYRPCGARRVIYGPMLSPWYGWHAGLGIFIGPRIVVGPRYIVPRYVAPRYLPPRYGPPRYNPPRRGGDNRREENGDDRGRGGRGGDGRGNGDDNGKATPRGQGGNDGPPRRAVPKEEHTRPAQSASSAPIGRPTNEQRRERIAVPKGGSDQGGDKDGDKGGNKGGGRGGGRGRSGG